MAGCACRSVIHSRVLPLNLSATFADDLRKGDCVRTILCILLFGAVGSIAGAQTVTVSGQISDSQCAFNVHSNGSSHADLLKSGVVGRTPKQCTQACVRMGGKYVLIDTVNKRIYHLANPDKAVDFAAMQVRVQGMVDQKGLLSITSIEVR